MSLQASDGSGLAYSSGRNERETIDVSGKAYLRFTNSLVFLCGRGLQHWGMGVSVENFESVDCEQSAALFGNAHLKHALINANSSQPGAQAVGPRLGFQFYDTGNKALLEDVEFRNFSVVAAVPGGLTDGVINAMDHSDTYKPQDISGARGVNFENCNPAVHVNISPRDVGAAYLYHIVDFDGSVSGSGQPSLIGSHVDWWNLGTGCSLDPASLAWVCALSPDRTVASIELNVPGLTKSEDGINTHHHIGYVCQRALEQATTLGADMDSQRNCLVLTRNAQVTGVAGRVWDFRLFGAGYSANGLLAEAASPKSFNFQFANISPGAFVLARLTYERSTSFQVWANSRFFGGRVALPMAPSLQHVLTPEEPLNDPENAACIVDPDNNPRIGLCDRGGVGPAWYFDAGAGTLWVRLVNLNLYLSQPGPEQEELRARWTVGGMALTEIDYYTTLEVNASCASIDGNANLCAAGRRVAAASLRSGDSCTRVDHSQILPPLLELARTAVLGEWLPGKDYPLQTLGSAPALLSMDGLRGDVVQLRSQADFDACATSGVTVLHTFSAAFPAFVLELPSEGHYWFSTSSAANCLQGQRVAVRVGSSSSPGLILATPPANFTVAPTCLSPDPVLRSSSALLALSCGEGAYRRGGNCEACRANNCPAWMQFDQQLCGSTPFHNGCVTGDTLPEYEAYSSTSSSETDGSASHLSHGVRLSGLVVALPLALMGLEIDALRRLVA